MKKAMGGRGLACWIAIVGVLTCLASGCRGEDPREAEIAAIDIEFGLWRFDRAISTSGEEDLPELKRDYPFLFPDGIPDSVWVTKMTDSLEREIRQQIDSVYGDMVPQREAVRDLFQHISYYFEGFRAPDVVVLSNRVDYDYKIIWADSLLLLALDNYLGSGHKYYKGIPSFVAQVQDPRMLLPDIAATYVKRVNPYPRDRTFLARMVHYGKELYLKQLVLPDVPKHDLIGYTQEQWDWAEVNEEQAWRFMVEGEYLYDTDQELDRRFLDPGPFSKFGLVGDRDIPPMMGRYLGWRIVEAYASRTEAEIETLLRAPAEELFKESRFKPRK